MYSNFITPPDFIEEDKHTVTVIDATTEEVELLCKIAQNSSEDYNVYLYRSEMNDLDWLNSAVKNSDSVIVNIDHFKNSDFLKTENTYYYGQEVLVSPAQKINSILDYFYIRQQIK